MKVAALYVAGRVVMADSHLAAFQSLTIQEQNSQLVSGFFDPKTKEFDTDQNKDHFYNKEMLLVRHAAIVLSTPNIDPPISTLGEFQALQLAKLIQKQDFQGVKGYTSPCLRCLQTAQIISDITDLEFEVSPQISERPPHLNGGPKTIDLPNRKEEFPQFNWPTEEEFHIPTETEEEFETRVATVLQHLPNRAMLVTHFGVICNMANLALCNERARMVIENGIPTASITSINNHEWRQLTDAKDLQN